MRETIKEYLSFSKKERTGIFVLIAIIGVVAILPRFYTATENLYGDSTALYRFRDQIALLESSRNQQADLSDTAAIETINVSPGQQNYKGDYSSKDRSSYALSRLPASQIKMFHFDPNLISIDDWKRLGLSEKTAVTIEKYRSKGGRFRQPEDILKIYGLSESDKQRLLPFVSMIPEAGRHSASAGKQTGSTSKVWSGSLAAGTPALQQAGVSFKRKTYINTDVNAADTSAWTQLPGIGAVLSQRIVRYREKLGGFYTIDQVAEVYGLQDSVFQKIRPYLLCDAGIQKINVNGATPEMLEQHPYLKRQLARAIVDYRTQHGSFRQLQDLKQIIAISSELFERIAPYLEL